MVNFLLPELIDEIDKFTRKNKYETYIMFLLSRNQTNMFSKVIYCNLHISYFSKSKKLFKWFLNHYNHKKLINYDMLHNFFDTISFKINDKIVKLNNDNIDYPICNNNLQIVKWFIKNKYQINQQTFESAVYYGNLKIIKYLLLHGKPDSIDCLYIVAIGKNNLKMLKWLKNKFRNHKPTNKRLYNCAINENRLKIVKWLGKNNENFPKITSKKLLFLENLKKHYGEIEDNYDEIEENDVKLFNAIKKGNLKHVKKLYKNNFINKYKFTSFILAIKNPNLDIAMWFILKLNIKDNQCTSMTLQCAIQRNDIKAIKLLIKNSITYLDIEYDILRYGNVKTIKLFLENNLKISYVNCNFARANLLAKIKWLEKNNNPLVGILFGSEQINKSQICRWLNIAKLPWNEDTFIKDNLIKNNFYLDETPQIRLIIQKF
jgi:hypothetical protein